MKKEASRQIDSVIFEGMTSINAVLKGNGNEPSRKIIRVLFDEKKKRSKRREFEFLQRSSVEYGFELVTCSGGTIDEIAIGNTHGGIIAECEERVIPELNDSSNITPNGFYVMLEGIEDPYNFGYALRTLYAAGSDGIILPPRNWLSAAGVVCRASAGASEMLPSFIADPLDACKYLKNLGYKVVCAGIRDSVSVFDADMKKPILLIVGGEKRGVSSALAEMCELTVRLDYGREFKGSLSAASAASVLAYEVFRQNRK